jgi:D-alanine-D-alanine ligase
MLIGLTYDLRDDYRGLGLSEDDLAEFDSPETVAAIETALHRMGYTTDRIGHVRALAHRLVAGDRWDLVFNIAEGLKGRSREAQVPALLETYDLPYTLSDPLTHAVGLDKAMAKRIVRDAGVKTANFAVLATPDDDQACDLPLPIFVKPVAEGTGKGCERASKVTSYGDLGPTAQQLRHRFGQPALAETFLAGREFTIGILGQGQQARVIGVLEIVLLETADAEIYSFENKELCADRVVYRLADDDEATSAGQTALAAYRALGCRDAARVDMRSDEQGQPHFLEVNTLPGMHPTHSDLPMLAKMAGLPFEALVGEIVLAALHRYNLSPITEAQRDAL